MITIVTGPPCAGKSTYVRNRAKTGDVVIDLDRIALALTSETTTHHDYPEHIRRLAITARRAALTQALHATGCDVWVIHAKPNNRHLAEYHRRGATIIELTAPLAVLLDRAAKERPPWVADRIRTWHTEPDDL